MSAKENAQALQAMAALLPENDPRRRDLEADAYRQWKQVDPKRAKALAKTWDFRKTPHFRRLQSLFEFDPRDPDLARALMPMGGERVDYCENWIQQLLNTWQEGDIDILVHPLRACNNAGQFLPSARTLVEKMPQFTSKEREILLILLMRQICRHCIDPKDIGIVVTLATYGGENVGNRLFLEGVCLWALEVREYRLGDWHREFRKETKDISAPWVHYVNLMVVARKFDMRYRYSKPKKVSPRFAARWRRLDEAENWMRQLPIGNAYGPLWERRYSLRKTTARHLREGAEAYLAARKEGPGIS